MGILLEWAGNDCLGIFELTSLIFGKDKNLLSSDNRVILISGANRGIGFTTAKLLGSSGFRLSLGARDPDTINTAEFDCDVVVSKWDANNPEDSSKWVGKTIARFGQIDGVVLNAGVLIRAGLEDQNDDAYNTMWQTNFMGPLRLIRSAMPHLRRSKHGRVANIVSLSGKRLLGKGALGYAASKFAASALTHAIRQEGWSDEVRATSICPGLVDTDMVIGVEPPVGEFKIAPETVANTIAYALSLPNEAVVAEILINSRLESSF